MNAIEKQIFTRVVEDLRTAGYTPVIGDGEDDYPELTELDQMIDLAGNLDECWLTMKVGPSITFVWFIWSNGNGGRDCITDYGVSLSPIIDPIMKWSDSAEAALLVQ